MPQTHPAQAMQNCPPIPQQLHCPKPPPMPLFNYSPSCHPTSLDIQVGLLTRQAWTKTTLPTTKQSLSPLPHTTQPAAVVSAKVATTRQPRGFCTRCLPLQSRRRATLQASRQAWTPACSLHRPAFPRRRPQPSTLARRTNSVPPPGSATHSPKSLGPCPNRQQLHLQALQI